jgi:Uma2 family endonuclease
MSVPSREGKEFFTYADYYSWNDGERWELIDGRVFNMTPTPPLRHQYILGKLLVIIAGIADTEQWYTFMAPFDVRFSADEQTYTVVQPDISVFCDPDKLDERGAIGVPDLIVEILTPFTCYKDLSDKLRLYQNRGVREYWVVNGDAPWVMIYRLGPGGIYGKPDYYVTGESALSEVLGGAEIELDRFLRPE